MSIATDQLTKENILSIRRAESDVRRIAKEHGITVRKSKISGIYVTFADGEKEKFWGWKSILTHFIIFLDLKD